MAKAKVGKIDMGSINGVDLPTGRLKLDIFYESSFFIYLPEYLVGVLAADDKKTRLEGNGRKNMKEVAILTGKGPDEVRDKLYRYLDLYFNQTIKEEKIIYYQFKFNSKKIYFNHKQNISFADSPAMSLKWGIHYLITFPDGQQTVLSDRYKNFGTICSNKLSISLDKYTEERSWIPWTEERQLFFENTEKSMEDLIAKVNEFFNQDPTLLAQAVDSSVKLIG